MALIDTNLLVYAALGESPLHAKAKKFLKDCVEGTETWHLAWQNVYEFIRVTTDPRLMPRRALYIDEAVAVLRRLLAAPALQLIHPGPRHFEIFADIAASSPGIRAGSIHDARLVAVMIENGVKQIATADDSFRRFRDIQVLNPLA